MKLVVSSRLVHLCFGFRGQSIPIVHQGTLCSYRRGGVFESVNEVCIRRFLLDRRPGLYLKLRSSASFLSGKKKGGGVL